MVKVAVVSENIRMNMCTSLSCNWDFCPSVNTSQSVVTSTETCTMITVTLHCGDYLSLYDSPTFHYHDSLTFLLHLCLLDTA
jgi:hypothetical protein